MVSDSVWGAMEGRRVLNVNWDDGPKKNLNSAAVTEALKQAAAKKGASLYSVGEVSKSSGRRVSAEYHLPFMAHAPMEPGNCAANYSGDRCELWAPTQVPQDCRDSVAQAVGLVSRPGQSECHADGRVRAPRWNTIMRSNPRWSRKRCMRQRSGAPVKVIWTREDDMRCSTYRPASLHQLSAVLDGAGLAGRLYASPDCTFDQRQGSARTKTASIPISRTSRLCLWDLPNVSAGDVLAELRRR